MRPGVVDSRRYAVTLSHRQTCLKRVIVRIRRRVEVVDVEERSARWRKRPVIERPSSRDRRIWRLIDIAIAEELCPVRSDVAHLRHDVLEKLLLEVQVE